MPVEDTSLFMTGANYAKKASRKRHGRKSSKGYRAPKAGRAGSKKMSLGYLLKYY